MSRLTRDAPDAPDSHDPHDPHDACDLQLASRSVGEAMSGICMSCNVTLVLRELLPACQSLRVASIVLGLLADQPRVCCATVRRTLGHDSSRSGVGERLTRKGGMR